MKRNYFFYTLINIYHCFSKFLLLPFLIWKFYFLPLHHLSFFFGDSYHIAFLQWNERIKDVVYFILCNEIFYHSPNQRLGEENKSLFKSLCLFFGFIFVFKKEETNSLCKSKISKPEKNLEVNLKIVKQNKMDIFFSLQKIFFFL